MKTRNEMYRWMLSLLKQIADEGGATKWGFETAVNFYDADELSVELLYTIKAAEEVYEATL